MIFYHSTLERNRSSILTQGILPRTHEFYDKLYYKLLVEYDIDENDDFKNHWVYDSIQDQLKWSKEARVGEVCLSGSRRYSSNNGYAGVEVECDWRRILYFYKFDRWLKVNHFNQKIVDNNNLIIFSCKINYFELREKDREMLERINLHGYTLEDMIEVRVKKVKPEQIILCEPTHRF